MNEGTRKLATSPKNEKVEGILRHASNEVSKLEFSCAEQRETEETSLSRDEFLF